MIAHIFLAIALLLPAMVAALPTPIPQASQTPPPDIAAPSPTPLPLLVNGQVIDIERGFIVFTTGDALRLAPDAQLLDDASGKPLASTPLPGMFAAATLDATNGLVTAVRFSHKPIERGTAVAQIPRQYVVQASTPAPNPELAPPPAKYHSLSGETLVRIVVEVPPNTPFTDDVFMTTDTGGWNPQAVKMQRQDALHFFIELRLRTGSEFHYLFTRGSWNSAERDRNGLERAPRDLVIEGSDLLSIDTTVYRWADLP
ncbi:MAG: hypothetical protein JO219_09635 [Candidatus Eremiobacteraeota bacterium]|nr:hypothetical protein [Candidatus Eremiobacteraeota bacterium]